MIRLRAILAMLIALSLALTPVSSAWAAMQMLANMDARAATSPAPPDAEMSDCMKAMQTQGSAHGQAHDQKCPGCDTPSKAPCASMGACLAKCSVHVIALLDYSAENIRLPIRHNWPADAQEPPDWAFAPPAPPPRA